MGSVLAQVAAAAPFSALRLGSPDDTWQPAATLYDDPGPLVERVRAALGGCEPRVAASTLGLGWAGRLWTLSLGTLAGFEVAPALTDLRWRDAGGRVELLLPPEATRPGGVPEVFEEVVEGHLRPLFAALRPLVAEGALWGNAASSLAAAGRLLAPDLGSRGMAEVLLTAAEAVEELLATEPLAGRLEPSGRRLSCCLFYRVPGGGLCNDCSLDEVPIRA